MRYRPRNHREKNPEVFAQLVKNNPYMAKDLRLSETAPSTSNSRKFPATMVQ